jgi:hypothetical protein
VFRSTPLKVIKDGTSRFSRFSTTALEVPYTNLVNEIPYQQYVRVSREANEMLQQSAQMKELSWLKQARDVQLDSQNLSPASTKPMSFSANFLTWASDNASKNRLLANPEGILNFDKKVLITLLKCLEERGDVFIKKDVVVVNEGCDTGDYLMLFIPLLKKLGAERIKVFLTNGNKDKLALAAKIGKSLLSESDVFFSRVNAFDGVPTELDKYRDFQMIFSPFRLMIVERPDKIRTFLLDRLSYMRSGDIGICSFLHQDSVAETTMIDLGWKSQQDKASLGYSIFKKKSSAGLVRYFEQVGIDLRERDRCNTSFSQEKVQRMFQEIGGEVLHISLIRAHSDEKKRVNLLGTIFKKQSPQN